EAEDAAAAQRVRALLDDADVAVAVFDRRGEIPFLERCAHARVLARRHAAAQHERLRAAADTAEQRAHEHLVRPRCAQALAANLSAAGLRYPKSLRVEAGHRCSQLFVGARSQAWLRSGS